jgi:hypothetical protein
MTNPSIFPNPILSGDATPLVLNFWTTSPDPTANPPVVGVPRSLVGYTVGVTIKAQPAGDVDTAAQYQQDIVGDATGVISFGLPGLPVGAYWIDVKIWDSSNVRSPVIPPTQFNVSPSITDRLVPTP